MEDWPTAEKSRCPPGGSAEPFGLPRGGGAFLCSLAIYAPSTCFHGTMVDRENIETLPLSEKHQKELAAAMKETGEKETQKEFRAATGISEPENAKPEKLEVEPGPLRFVDKVY